MGRPSLFLFFFLSGTEQVRRELRRRRIPAFFSQHPVRRDPVSFFGGEKLDCTLIIRGVVE